MITLLQNVSNSGVSGGDVDGSFGGCGSWGVVLLDVEVVFVVMMLVMVWWIWWSWWLWWSWGLWWS